MYILFCRYAESSCFINKCSGWKTRIVPCADTDMLVILIGNKDKFESVIKISTQFGPGKMYYKVFEVLGSEICAGSTYSTCSVWMWQ